MITPTPEVGKKIHIVDSDTKRRAKIAFALQAADIRAEIYESIDEAVDADPSEGLLLLHDELDPISVDENSRRIAIPFALYGKEPSVSQVVDAMLTGAVDYLEWPFETGRVADTLARYENDLNSVSRAMTRQRQAQNAIHALSPRELEVLRQMVNGAANKEIAANLGISPRTVEVHRANVLLKTGAKSSADAVRIGIYAGLDE